MEKHSATAADQLVGEDNPIKSRIAYFDGLRGLAILLVLTAHYAVRVLDGDRLSLVPILVNGYSGVHLFLILSGLCIGWSYVREEGFAPFSWREFVYRRATRILPAYYAALLLSVLVVLARGTLSGQELFFQITTHLTLIHNLSPRSAIALNPPFWSLALEAQLYLCFPAVLAAVRRFGLCRTLVALFIVQSVYRFYVLQLGLHDPKLDFVVPWALPGRIFEFAVGFALAIGIRRRVRFSFWGRQTNRFLLCGWIVGSILGSVAAKQLGRAHPGTDLLWTLSYVLLIACVANGGRARSFFELRPIVGLGIVSYSIYLIHYPLVGSIARRLFPASAPDAALFWGALPAVIAAMAASVPFYFLVERPAQAFLKKRTTAAGQIKM